MNALGCVHLLKVHLHTITTGVECPGAFGPRDPVACSWAVVSSPDTGLLAFLRFGD